MIVAGIDAGSRTIKAVLWDSQRKEMLASAIADQGVEQETLARRLFHGLLDQSGVRAENVEASVATGYGRKLIAFADRAVTEITCHAAGVHHLVPATRTIVDLGGQDSKIIHLDGGGAVREFVMNDRCAAGTGRFLEMLATRLGVELSGLGELARASADPAAISSMCVVFAETEIVGLLASGVAREDICAGVQKAIARRIAAMAGRSLHAPVTFTGGGALTPGMAEALGDVLGREVTVAPRPQYTGALGAALLAARGRDDRPS